MLVFLALLWGKAFVHECYHVALYVLMLRCMLDSKSMFRCCWPFRAMFSLWSLQSWHCQHRSTSDFVRIHSEDVILVPCVWYWSSSPDDLFFHKLMKLLYNVISAKWWSHVKLRCDFGSYLVNWDGVIDFIFDPNKAVSTRGRLHESVSHADLFS